MDEGSVPPGPLKAGTILCRLFYLLSFILIFIAISLCEMARSKKEHITIRKNKNGTFTIVRDENFAKLMAVSFSFHSKYMEAVSLEKGHIVQESPKFLELMEKISCDNKKTIQLVLSDIRILHEWVKCITEIIISIPTTDLKNNNLLTFFRLSEDFGKKTTKIVEIL